MRKHIGWYIAGMRGAAQMRTRINLIEDPQEARDALLSGCDEWVNALPYEWAGNLEERVRYALYVLEDA